MKIADLRPQLAKTLTKTSPPMETVLKDPEWICQRKWDGMRAIFHIVPGKGVLIFSRTGQDLNDQFPDLQWLAHAIKSQCILDGEIVALNAEDREDLELLQLRLGDKQARRKDEIPVGVRFFDVLAAKIHDKAGFDGQEHPLVDRLHVLKMLLIDANQLGLYCEEVTDTPPAHWEGIVAKRADSHYRLGKRTSEWLKYKVTHRATLKVVGLTEGKGARADSFGAVMVQDADGIDRGQVGSGFNDSHIKEILDLVEQGVEFLVEVEYRFLSKTGLLVNTSYKGVRHDKDEADRLG